MKDGTNWYAYCGNAPMGNVDWLGLAPSVLEAALMAQHIYNYDKASPKEYRGVKNNGEYTHWRLIDSAAIGDSRIGVYIKFDETHEWRNPLEYVLAFKGTEFSSLEDWANNLEQTLGEYSKHLSTGLKYAGEFVKKYSKYEITFVGHSKGGGEAAVNAEFWNRRAIVFNPSLPAALFAVKDQGYVHSYVMRGDILNYHFGELPIGTTTYFKPLYGCEVHGINTWDMIKNHSMESIITAIQRGKYE